MQTGQVAMGNNENGGKCLEMRSSKNSTRGFLKKYGEIHRGRFLMEGVKISCFFAWFRIKEPFAAPDEMPEDLPPSYVEVMNSSKSLNIS